MYIDIVFKEKSVLRMHILIFAFKSWAILFFYMNLISLLEIFLRFEISFKNIKLLKHFLLPIFIKFNIRFIYLFIGNIFFKLQNQKIIIIL